MKSAVESPSSARVFRAPGRVNLIGEHTDYNDGFVMPVALDFSTWVTISPRADRIISLCSENFGEQISFDLEDPAPLPKGHWSDYVKGVAIVLEQAGYRLRGADLRIRGEVPIGSGLSSSAAIEVAAGCALLENSDLAVDRLDLARLCQRAENEFVGMRCGIMDQFISCHGQRGNALMLDCRSLEYSLLPLPDNVRLVICNTMVKHELAASEYNKRRAQCEAGVDHLAGRLDAVSALRDVTSEGLEKHGCGLPSATYRRCRHVITENERVLKAAVALERGDLADFGNLMNESHVSLRDDYEVSCAELDLMVGLGLKVNGVYGSRMTGGGFGGCTISLVRMENVEEFRRSVGERYEKATGCRPEIYVCEAAGAASEVVN